LDLYSRAIVLCGQNVASYKFALPGALLDIGTGSEDHAETVIRTRHQIRALKAVENAGPPVLGKTRLVAVGGSHPR
jgi:hypothetical protein